MDSKVFDVGWFFQLNHDEVHLGAIKKDVWAAREQREAGVVHCQKGELLHCY